MLSLQERRAVREAGHAVAAITFGIPIISVSIADDRPHFRRARYQPNDPNFGLEAMVAWHLPVPNRKKKFADQRTMTATASIIKWRSTIWPA